MTLDHHPFWQGVHDFECGVAFTYDAHPAWVHGWESAEEWADLLKGTEA